MNVVIPKRYVMRCQELKIVRKFKSPKKMKKVPFVLFNDVLIWGKLPTFGKVCVLDTALPTNQMKVRQLASSKEYSGKNQIEICSSGDQVVVSCPNAVRIRFCGGTNSIVFHD